MRRSKKFRPIATLKLVSTLLSMSVISCEVTPEKEAESKFNLSAEALDVGESGNPSAYACTNFQIAKTNPETGQSFSNSKKVQGTIKLIPAESGKGVAPLVKVYSDRNCISETSKFSIDEGESSQILWIKSEPGKVLLRGLVGEETLGEGSEIIFEPNLFVRVNNFETSVDECTPLAYELRSRSGYVLSKATSEITIKPRTSLSLYSNSECTTKTKDTLVIKPGESTSQVWVKQTKEKGNINLSGSAKGDELSQTTIAGGLMRFTNDDINQTLKLSITNPDDQQIKCRQVSLKIWTGSDEQASLSPAASSLDAEITVKNGKVFADSNCFLEGSKVNLPEGGNSAFFSVLVESGSAEVVATSEIGEASLTISD